MHGIVAIGEPALRLTGTLIHTALAYHYAAGLATPPAWFKKKTMIEAIEEDGRGHPELIKTTFEVYQAFKARFVDDAWRPIAVEQEFEAKIGEIDPGGVDPTLDNEIVTCRTDLVIEVNGDLWIVDHKSTGGTVGDKLPAWKADGEWKMNWQVMLNLAILRAPSNVAKLGGRVVRGFMIQRIKQRRPFDFDRHPVQISPKAYGDVGRVARAYVAEERRLFELAKRGEKPIPNYAMCWGRYGPCDYYALCGAQSDLDQKSIIEHNYRSTRLPVLKTGS